MNACLPIAVNCVNRINWGSSSCTVSELTSLVVWLRWFGPKGNNIPFCWPCFGQAKRSVKFDAAVEVPDYSLNSQSIKVDKLAGLIWGGSTSVKRKGLLIWVQWFWGPVWWWTLEVWQVGRKSFGEWFGKWQYNKRSDVSPSLKLTWVKWW